VAIAQLIATLDELERKDQSLDSMEMIFHGMSISLFEAKQQ